MEDIIIRRAEDPCSFHHTVFLLKWHTRFDVKMTLPIAMPGYKDTISVVGKVNNDLATTILIKTFEIDHTRIQS